MGETELRQTEPPRPRLPPHMLFFPAAALYGAVVLPWSIFAMTRVVAGPASLATAFGHAHELLLGYALAVVAGNQLPPMSRSRALVLFGLWAAARLTFVMSQSHVALALDMAFAVALAMHVAPRLFRTAKSFAIRGCGVDPLSWTHHP